MILGRHQIRFYLGNVLLNVKKIKPGLVINSYQVEVLPVIIIGDKLSATDSNLT